MTERKNKSFFKDFITSIKDFDKYPELAIKSWKEVILYITIIILIFTAIASIAYTYTISNQLFNTTNEEFNEIVEKYDIQGINRNDFLEYFSGTNSIILYIEVYFIIFVCLLIVNCINTAINVFILSTLGYIATIFMKMRIRMNAMIKIAIYSLTLPIILNIVVIYTETFTTFEVKYFELMYLMIAYIYILAAISIIRMDIIKNKQELMNIMEEQKRVREELERQEEEKKKEEEEKRKLQEKDKNEEKDENEDKKEDKDEPQGDGT